MIFWRIKKDFEFDDIKAAVKRRLDVVEAKIFIRKFSLSPEFYLNDLEQRDQTKYGYFQDTYV